MRGLSLVGAAHGLNLSLVGRAQLGRADIIADSEPNLELVQRADTIADSEPIADVEAIAVRDAIAVGDDATAVGGHCCWQGHYYN